MLVRESSGMEAIMILSLRNGVQTLSRQVYRETSAVTRGGVGAEYDVMIVSVLSVDDGTST